MPAIEKNEVWKQIEQDFVYGIEIDGMLTFPSYRFLGEKYNTSKTIINDKSREEGWELTRESFKNKIGYSVSKKKMQMRTNGTDSATDRENGHGHGQITQKEIDEIVENESGVIAAFDVSCAKLAQEHLDAAQRNLSILTSEAKEKETINPKVLLDNIKVASEAQELYKNAIGARLPNTPFSTLDYSEEQINERIDEYLQKRELDNKK